MAPKWEVNGDAAPAWLIRERTARREGFRIGLIVGLGVAAFVILTLVLTGCASPTAPRASSCLIPDTVTFLDATTHQPSQLIVTGHRAGCTDH